MQCNKKISADLLQLTLLVILLRLGSDRFPDNRWNEDVEVHEIYLGPSSAYAQFNFHNHRTSTHALIYRKNIDSVIIDDTLSILEGINYRNLDQFRRRENSVLAFYVSSESTQDERQSAQEDTNSALPSPPSSLVSTAEQASADEGPHSPEQASLTQNHQGSLLSSPVSRELTDEDLDLIEILLKEDIEPGVPLDNSFDSFESDQLTSSNQKELRVPEDVSTLNEFAHQASPFHNFWDTIHPSDGSQPVDPLASEQLSNDEEKCTVIPSDTFANGLCNEMEDDPYGSVLANSPLINMTSNSTFGDFFPDFDEDVSVDEESMFTQLDKLEKLKRNDAAADSAVDEEPVSELYPNMEDCWQDITTTLPLPVIGSTHHGASLSLLTRPSLTYSGVSSFNYPLSSSQANSNENFSGILLQNATLTPPTSDVSGTFSYVPTALGPSSIGCAVAASMATLTNDTDPLPESGTVTSYNPEFPELVYPNHTAVASQGEYILSDFLIDEDLQLMDMSASSETNYVAPTNAVGEHMDASSDSAVSLTSGRVPSISDCQEWVDSCSESSHQGDHDGSFMQMETAFSLNQNPGVERGYSSDHGSAQYSSNMHTSVAQKKYKLFGRKTSTNNEEIESGSNSYKQFAHGTQPNKEFLYLPMKQPTDELVSCSYGPLEGATAAPHEPNFGMPSSLSSANYVPYPQHNHSYHLPFISSNCLEKPVTRDKTRSSKLDSEPSNRDEKRARAMKLPISIHDIINLAIDEFNERLSKYDLTEAQHTLIRDIRRRGKNKVAAQNCRKRKMDQINTLQQDLDSLQAERLQLETEQSQMLHQRRYYEDKYAKLYQYVLQASNSQTDSNSVLPSCDISLPSDSSTSEPDKGTDSNRGARTKKKMEKKSP